MARGFSHSMTVLFDLLLSPFGDHRTLGLTVLSILTGVLLIFVFKATSNQERIRAARDAFKARVLEMRIYQDNLGLITRALGGALATNLTYLRVSLKPILILLVIVAGIYFQLDERYGRDALAVGSPSTLTVELKPGIDVITVPIDLEGGDAVAVESPPVRVPDRRELSWRIRATGGDGRLTVTVYDVPYELEIVSRATNVSIGHTRRANSTVDHLVHPSLPAIPRNSAISGIQLSYPDSRFGLFGWQTHWLVVFVVWSFIGALVPKFLFRIQV